MGKKNKKNNKMENEEEKDKTKNKKSEPASQSISTVSEPSKNNITIINKDQNNTKTGIKNKKLYNGNHNELVIDICHGKLEEDTKNKIPNDSNDVGQHIRIKNKNKKRKAEDDEQRNVESKVRKVKTYESNMTQEKSGNKKIVLDDKSQKSLDKSKKNKHKFLNDDEAEVRDEDIDKFCDEITEEDNETYENWVQLFETHFKKSKKPI